MIYHCCDDRRRTALEGHPNLNGIDFLEVLDDESLPDSQRTLFLHFVNPVTTPLAAANIRLEGGERIRSFSVTTVAQIAPRVVQVDLDRAGDFSTYTLRLVAGPGSPAPPAGYDPMTAAVKFSFKVNCDSDFDCDEDLPCPPEQWDEPEIDYLAKDFNSFRRLMLDRMTQLLPSWQERNPADLGVTLVELLAYAGDYLSYYQDAVATEAYLETARRRVSVKRHARLVDYFMHDGANARVWIHVDVTAPVVLPVKTQFFTRTLDEEIVLVHDPDRYRQLLAASPEVFETMHEAHLFPDQGEMKLYTWGALECCLPVGANQATLSGHHPNLQAGDALIFKEKKGPETGLEANADADHRQAVRLTQVTLTTDPLGGQFKDPPDSNPVPVTEIAWNPADALTFSLCVSAMIAADEKGQFHDDIGVALGNIVLADHGLTLRIARGGKLEKLPVPAAGMLYRVREQRGDRCRPVVRQPIPARYRPALKEKPLTQHTPYPDDDGSLPPAGKMLVRSLDSVKPDITLLEADGTTWDPVRDLLNSDDTVREFVVEIETGGDAALRFGDGVYGRRPEAGLALEADYRIGNGRRGNVGADTIIHLASNDSAIESVSNPIAAQGGVDPESVAQVRQLAPTAFRRQERAVTPDDYAEMAARHPEVQKAAATLRWTGSWHTVFLTVDRVGGLEVDDVFEAEMFCFMDRYRMAGHDVEVDSPRYVSLEIVMRVCVKPNYFRSDVRGELLRVFSNRLLADGRRGVFHPDNFSFNQPVYLSQLVAAAEAVAGVDSVAVTTFQRQGIDSQAAIVSGRLDIGRLEIARLDNDPNFPERGLFSLVLEGGK